MWGGLKCGAPPGKGGREGGRDGRTDGLTVGGTEGRREGREIRGSDASQRVTQEVQPQTELDQTQSNPEAMVTL